VAGQQKVPIVTGAKDLIEVDVKALVEKSLI
jgi:hypothetical protein